MQRSLWPVPFAHNVLHTALLILYFAKPQFAKMRLLLVGNLLGHFKSLAFRILKSHIKCVQKQIEHHQIQSSLFPLGTGSEWDKEETKNK